MIIRTRWQPHCAVLPPPLATVTPASSAASVRAARRCYTLFSSSAAAVCLPRHQRLLGVAVAAAPTCSSPRLLHACTHHAFHGTPPPSPPPSVHALHVAKTAWELERCVRSMLALGEAQRAQAGETAALQQQQLQRAQQAEDDAALGGSAPSRRSTSSSTFDGLSLPVHEVSGPQLLTSSVYDLMLSRLLEFGLAPLAEQVQSHMVAMRMTPSPHARRSLALMALQARPVRWKLSLRVWQLGADEFRRALTVKSVFKSATNPAPLRELAALVLEACLLSARPEEAATVLSDLRTLTGSLDVGCTALTIAALCLPHPEARIAQADALFAQLWAQQSAAGGNAATSSCTPTLSLPPFVLTPLIIAHADTGDIAGALALLQLQRQSFTMAHRMASAAAYIHVIAACMQRGREDDALKLWTDLHQLRSDSSITLQLQRSGSSAAAPSPAATPTATLASLQELPFALRLPSTLLASDAEQSPVADASPAELLVSLRFHFSPVALRQWSALRRHIWATRRFEHTEHPVDDPSKPPRRSQPVDRSLAEFASAGRTYLLWSLLHQMRGLAATERGALFCAAAIMHLAEACLHSPHGAQWPQALAIQEWLQAQANSQLHPRVCLALLRCYAQARPQVQWAKALQLRSLMDEQGEPLRPAHLQALFDAGLRACKIGREDDPLLLSVESATALSTLSAASADSSSSSPLPVSVSLADAGAAWSSLSLLSRQVHPALLTGALQRTLLRAALGAHQWDAALSLFVTQWHEDEKRLAHMQEQQLLQADASVPSALPVLAPLNLLFRLGLEQDTLNALLQACTQVSPPQLFLAAQIYHLLLQPESLHVPLPAEVEASAQVQLAAKIDALFAGKSPAEVTAASTSLSAGASLWPDWTSHWMLVCGLDQLQAVVLQRSQQPPAVVGEQAAGAAEVSLTQQEHVSSQLLAPVRGDDGLYRLPVCPPALTSTPLPDLQALLDLCAGVELFAFDALEQGEHLKNGVAPAIWRGGAAAESAASSSASAPRASKGATSPITIDLSALTVSTPSLPSGALSPALLSHVESVLHLAIRRLQSLYLSTGQLSDLLVLHDMPSTCVSGESSRNKRRKDADGIESVPRISDVEVQRAADTFAERARAAQDGTTADVFSADATSSSSAPVEAPVPPTPASASEWLRSGDAWLSDVSSASVPDPSEQVGAVVRAVLQHRYGLQLSRDSDRTSTRIKAHLLRTIAQR